MKIIKIISVLVIIASVIALGIFAGKQMFRMLEEKSQTPAASAGPSPNTPVAAAPAPAVSVPATGGTSTGGAPVTGGTAPGTGGTTSTGGTTIATGGAVSAAGGTASGGLATGGASSGGATPGSGGAVATGGSATGGADALASNDASDESGCGCHVAGQRSSHGPWVLLGLMALLGVRPDRRRRSTRHPSR